MSDNISIHHIKKQLEAELDVIGRELFPTKCWSGYRVDRDDRKQFLDTLLFERCSNVPTQEVHFQNNSGNPVETTHRSSTSRQRNRSQATVSVPMAGMSVSADTESEHTAAMEDAGAIPVYPPNTGGAYKRSTGPQMIWYTVSARQSIKIRIYPLKSVKCGVAGGAATAATGVGVGGAALGTAIGINVGTVVPVAGNIIGGIIGFAIGGVIGAAAGGGVGGGTGAAIGVCMSINDSVTVTPQDIFKRFDSGYVYCKAQGYQTTSREDTNCRNTFT